VTPAGGRALADARAVIPEGAAVLASNGVVGRFAGRAKIYMPMHFPFRLPVGTQPVYFVLSSEQGIVGPADAEGMIAQVAAAGAQLLFHKAGIWVFRLDPPATQRTLVLSGARYGLGAWRFRSTAGAPVTEGPPDTWRMQGAGRPGFVLWGDYWTEPAGNYEAAVRLTAIGRVSIRVWEPGSGKVLASQSLIGTGREELVRVPFTLGKGPAQVPASGLLGQGPFKIQSYAGAPGQLIEVQIISEANTDVSVYTVGVPTAS
jgi:hypothetical protein